jgi:putative DNA primase/helicase
MKSDAPSVSLVLAKLGVTPTDAAQYSARCPAHDDATASLSIGVRKDGTIGLHCHAGCSADEVCSALGLSVADLFPRKATPKRAAKRKAAARVAKPLTAAELEEARQAAKRLGPGSFSGFVLAAIYSYRDANGKTWGWRARYENKTGKKQIKPFHHDGSDWVLKEAPVPRKGKPLYRLPEVMASEGPVFIVEGEKCADALAAIGISATTSGAAKSPAKTDWTPLAGRTCIIWPDNDDPGDEYAADVAELLANLDADVRLIDVAALDLPNEGDDAADWLATNMKATVADVVALPTVAMDSAIPGVTLIRASDIPDKAMNWLWPGYLAGGMLTLLAGNGGTGKTTIALSLAAIITTGGRLPDGVSAPRGSVIIWSGEDALAEVLVPRLREAGADTSRVHFVTNGDSVFDPATDMPILARMARGIPDLALVIIDPIVSAVQGDSHKNAEVRRGLQPLLNLAAETGAAVIGITHYAKNTAGTSTTDRVIGSVAFNAVARVTLATAMGNDGEGRMVRAKNNVGITGNGFAYSIAVVDRKIDGTVSQVSKIVWGQPLYGFADDLLGQIESKRNPRDEAADWLTAALHAGPVASKELKAKAAEDGVAWRTVERAKDALNIIAERKATTGKARGTGEWVWRLPEVTKPPKYH